MTGAFLGCGCLDALFSKNAAIGKSAQIVQSGFDLRGRDRITCIPVEQLAGCGLVYG
jgi:hypothetical protein